MPHTPCALRVFRLVFDPDGAPAQPASPRDATLTTSDDASEVVEITFWQSVEAGGTPAEYRAYLDRYPNGSFTALAQARLASPSRIQARSPDPSIELAFWNSIKHSEDPQCSWLTWRNTRMASSAAWLISVGGPLTHLLDLPRCRGLLNTAFSTDNRVTEASREGFPSG